MHRSLKPGHVGSIPTGPTDKQALVVQRRGHRTRNAATWVRVPPGALGSLTIRLSTKRAHDVAAACRLAMADVRVRLPLGALRFRTWESLAFRVPREHEIAGSNPAVLTDAVGPVLVREGGC